MDTPIFAAEPANSFYQAIPGIAIDMALVGTQKATETTLSSHQALVARNALLGIAGNPDLDWLQVVQSWETIPELQEFAAKVRKVYLP